MASMKQSAIQLVLKAKDALSGKVKQSAESLQAFSAEAESLKDDLAKLENQQALLDSFQSQAREVRETGKAYREAEDKVKELAREYRDSVKPTQQLEQAYEKASNTLAESNNEYKKQQRHLAKLATQLARAERPVRGLERAEASATKAVETANVAYQKQKAELDKLQAKLASTKKPAKELRQAVTAVKKTVTSANRELQKKQHELTKTSKQLDEARKSSKALRYAVAATAKQTSEASKAFRQQEERVKVLRGSYDAARKNTRKLASDLETARKSVAGANREFQSQRSRLDRLRQSLKSAGLSSSNLASQQQRLAEEIEDTGNAFWKANRRAKEAERTLKKDTLKKVARDANQASVSVGSLVRRFAGLVGAATGLYAVKRSLEAILTTGDKFERLGVQLEALMGSAAEGDRALQWIKDFTKNTPYQLDHVTDAFVRLKAFGFDPMDGTMQAVVDQAIMLGGGFDRLRGIAVGLGQAWAKQRLQGEEILQLVERGVPVWEMLEKVTGKNVLEIRKLSETGKLGRDVIRALINEIARGADGAAAKNMTLLTGYVSNLKDEWSYFLDAIGDSGVLDYAKAQMKFLAEQIKAMNGDGRLQELAKQISNTFIAMGEAAKKAVADITIAEVISKAESGFSALTQGLNSVAKGFTVTTNAISAFFNGFLVSIKGMAAGVLYTAGEIINGWGLIAETIGADTIADKAKSTVNYLRSLGQAFLVQANDNAKAASESAGKVWEAVTEKAEDSVKQFQATLKRSTDQSKKATGELAESYQQVNEAVKDVGQIFGETFESAQQALEKINASETRVELAALGVVLAESLRAGVISQEEYYQATEASRAKLAQFNKEAEKTGKTVKDAGDTAEEAGEQQAEAMEGASSIASVMAGHYNAITAELQGMSSAAHDSFIAMQRGLGSVDTSKVKGDIADLKNELGEANQKLSDLRHASHVFDATGIRRWFQETATDAAYVKRAFLEQKIALEQLLEQYEQGDVSYQNFVRQGKQAAETLNLLNQQDLDKLNNAIASAEQSMASLGDSSRNTLNSLQDELDQLQGRQSDIEQRRYQNQRDDLKAQRAEATARGDQEAIKNLTSALRLSEQIYNERVRQANNDKAKAAQEQGSTVPPVQRPSPQKIIRLEYPGGDVNVGIAPNDETKLLEALKNAGMRTL